MWQGARAAVLARRNRRMFPLAAIGIVALGLAVISVEAAPVAPGQECQAKAALVWSDTERQIWEEKICVGQPVDLREQETAARILTPRFLQMVLMHEPWRSAITARGIEITGAQFDEPIDLDNLKIDHDLLLRNTIFNKKVSLVTATIGGDISFARSRFNDELDFERLTTSKSVFLNEAQFGAVQFYGVKIAGALEFIDARSGGPSINLTFADIGVLDLRRAQLSDVILAGAKISVGEAEDAKLAGRLQLSDATIASSFYLRGAELGEVSLLATKVGSFLDFDNAKLKGPLNADLATVGGSIVLRGVQATEITFNATKVANYADFTKATLTGHLSLDRADIASLDLTEARLASANLSAAKLGTASFNDATVSGALDMWDANVAGNVVMRNASMKGIVLTNTKIGSDLDLNGAKVEGNLDFRQGAVAANFTAMQAEIKEADLQGVRIGAYANLSEAKIAGTINFERADIAHLDLRKSSFADVSLTRAKLSTAILDDVVITDDLEAFDCVVSAGFFMRRAKFDTARLSNIKVGSLNLDETSATGAVELYAAVVAASLNMPKVRVPRIDLSNARIENDVDLSGSDIGGELAMRSTRVGSVINIIDATLNDVRLNDTKIGGSAILVRTVVRGDFEMEGASVGASLFLRDARIEKPAQFAFIKAENLWLSGAEVAGLDLTAATIKGAFALSDPASGNSKWSGPLTLRNATAGIIQGSLSSWPQSLDLRDFQYERLGGYVLPNDDMANYSVDGFLNWIARSRPFSPQPYEYLAALLAKSGYAETSRRLLFQAREGEREQAWPAWNTFPKLEYWVKSASLVFIGHTYRAYYILVWIAAFVLIGIIVVRSSGEARRLHLGSGLTFSFDRLIPLIRLNERHYEVNLHSRVRGYFYFHQVMGYVFGSFLVGWLSGLLK